MYSYHFPILVGTSKETRVVMVHLFPEMKPQNGNQESSPEQPVNTNNNQGTPPNNNSNNNQGAPSTDNQSKPEPEEYHERRIIFTTADPQDCLFKVRQTVNLIDPEGETVQGTLTTDEKKDFHVKANFYGGKSLQILEKNNTNTSQTADNKTTNTGDSPQENNTNTSQTADNKTTNTGDSPQENNTNTSQPVKDNYIVFTTNESRVNAGSKLISLNFSFKSKDGVEFKGALHIISVYQSQISCTNIDLGSEATQINNFLGENAIDRRSLIESFKTEKSYTNIDEYLSQFDNTNPYLYKTGNILYKKDGKLEDDYIHYLSLNLKGKNEYGTATNKDNFGKLEAEIKDTMTFPNIKVLYRSKNVIGTLHKFQKFIQCSSKDDDGNFRSILLLVPNIYSQLQVDKLSYYVSTEMNKDMEAPYYDIRVISESDAAFLGLMIGTDDSTGANNTETHDIQHDAFLLIDSGRGTTDISLIGRASDNMFTTLRRGGIVGAGGAIDYLFARIYAKHLYTERKVTGIKLDDFINNFMRWFSHLPSGPKEELRLEIEKIKIEKNWRKNIIKDQAIENIINANITDTDEHNKNPFEDLAESTKWDEEGLSLDEEDQMTIDALCNKIAKDTIDTIKVNGKSSHFTSIDNVIYSGRSFHYKPLEEAFKNELNRYRWHLLGSLITNKSWSYLNKRKLIGDLKGCAINFKTHNSNINLNSDICCLQDVLKNKDLNKKENRGVTLDMLFNGFGVKDKTVFYLGYFGLEQAWTKNVNTGTPASDPALIDMTLFPNKEMDKTDIDSINESLKEWVKEYDTRLLRAKKWIKNKLPHSQD